MKFFYYDRKQLWFLLCFNAVLLFLVALAGNYYPIHLGLISVVAVICLISFSATLYVIIFPQRLAVINDEGIKIDHNAILRWADIDFAEKIRVSGLLKREIIVFKIKAGIQCPLTYMQKICQNSPYSAFSIPLYAMTQVDCVEIEKNIAQHTYLKDGR